MPIESRPVADIALYVDVRQETHLDFLYALSLALLATPTLDVEAEAAHAISQLARLACLLEDLANFIEHTSIRGRVAAWRAADGRLVDLDDLVEVGQLHFLHQDEGCELVSGFFDFCAFLGDEVLLDGGALGDDLEDGVAVAVFFVVEVVLVRGAFGDVDVVGG